MTTTITHIHIKTTHKEGTPDYPSKEAIYIYHLACGLTDESGVGKFVMVSQQHPSVLETATCQPCLTAYKRILENAKAEPKDEIPEQETAVDAHKDPECEVILRGDKLTVKAGGLTITIEGAA